MCMCECVNESARVCMCVSECVHVCVRVDSTKTHAADIAERFEVVTERLLKHNARPAVLHTQTQTQDGQTCSDSRRQRQKTRPYPDTFGGLHGGASAEAEMTHFSAAVLAQEASHLLDDGDGQCQIEDAVAIL